MHLATEKMRRASVKPQNNLLCAVQSMKEEEETVYKGLREIKMTEIRHPSNEKEMFAVFPEQ